MCTILPLYHAHATTRAMLIPTMHPLSLLYAPLLSHTAIRPYVPPMPEGPVEEEPQVQEEMPGYQTPEQKRSEVNGDDSIYTTPRRTPACRMKLNFDNV